MNQKTLVRLGVSLVLSVGAFVGLLFVQKSILTPHGLINCVVAADDIPKNTIITSENVDKFFKEKNVDGELKVTNAAKTKAELINKKVTKDIEKGTVTSKNSFIEKDSFLSKIKNPTEVSLKASDVSQVLGGTIREGDIIDVSIVNPNTKELEFDVKSAYVSKAFSSESKEIKKNEAAPSFTINIIIPKEEEQKFNKAINTGSVRVSRDK